MTPTNIVCPHCHRRNRVPPERLHDTPLCGACKRTLLDGRPVSITETSSFFQHIQGSDLPLLVDFWAVWCGPCKVFAPTFDTTARTFSGRLQCLKVNVDEVPDLASQFGIRSIPTLLVFKAGQEVQRQAGALPEARLYAWLSPWLS